MRDEVTPDEWRARVEFAACYRLVDAYASSLAKIDLDGNVIGKPDTDYYVNKAGYVKHPGNV